MEEILYRMEILLTGKFYLRSADEEGRHTPVSSGYKPTAIIDDRHQETEIVIEGGGALSPGQSANAKLYLRSHFSKERLLYFRGRISRETRIELAEGARLIGDFKVECIDQIEVSKL